MCLAFASPWLRAGNSRIWRYPGFDTYRSAPVTPLGVGVAPGAGDEVAPPPGDAVGLPPADGVPPPGVGVALPEDDGVPLAVEEAVAPTLGVGVGVAVAVVLAFGVGVGVAAKAATAAAIVSDSVTASSRGKNASLARGLVIWTVFQSSGEQPRSPLNQTTKGYR